MKVKIVKTGETVEYNDSFAMRMIEQGKAIPVSGGKATANKQAVKRATVKPAEEGEYGK